VKQKVRFVLLTKVTLSLTYRFFAEIARTTSACVFVSHLLMGHIKYVSLISPAIMSRLSVR